MGQIQKLIPHQLGAVEAKTRLCSFVGSMMREYPDQVHQLEMRFAGNELQVRFSAYGFEYDWMVNVTDDLIELTGKYPEAANPYRSKIEATVVGKIEDLLCVTLRLYKAA